MGCLFEYSQTHSLTHTHTLTQTHTTTHTHSNTLKRSFFRVRSIFVPVVFCFPQRILSLNPPHRPLFPTLSIFPFPSRFLLCLPSSFHCVAFAVAEMCFGEFYSLGLFIPAMCKLFLSAQRLFIQGASSAAPRYNKCNMKLESTYLQVDFGYVWCTYHFVHLLLMNLFKVLFNLFDVYF